MQASEFEEREYEAPLYVQLGQANSVWAPGQVLEARVGFDRAFTTSLMHFWVIHGFRKPPSGVILGAKPFEDWWQRRLPPPSRPLPDFSLNLFIQVKRPFVGTRAAKSLRSVGLRVPYWRFRVSPDQQALLESLANSTADAALVTYACAAFDRVADLWLHTRNGSIVETSTFPAATSLRGHKAWYYNEPGCSGVANSVPKRIEDEPILERVRQFTTRRSDQQGADRSFGGNLKRLAASVQESLSTESIGDDARTAVYLEAVRKINELVDIVRMPQYSEAIRSYLAVAAFASIFKLQWYVLSRSED